MAAKIEKIFTLSSESDIILIGGSMNKIGSLIAERREKLGLSFKELSRKCRVSDTEIMKIENGTRQKPSWIHLCNMAKVLEISPLLLMEKAGYITEDEVAYVNRIAGIDRLSNENLVVVQKFINFLLSEQEKEGVTDD